MTSEHSRQYCKKPIHTYKVKNRYFSNAYCFHNSLQKIIDDEISKMLPTVNVKSDQLHKFNNRTTNIQLKLMMQNEKSRSQQRSKVVQTSRLVNYHTK